MTDIALAIDIGGSKLLVGLVDKNGNVVTQKKHVWDKPNKDLVKSTIVSLCNSLLKSSSVSPLIAGVNIPGLVDESKRVWLEACYSGISDLPIAQILEDEFGMPVYIENDVNNCAIAERTFGCCKDTEDFAWLTISNGCGGALYINNSLYTGAFGFAGEFGHINVIDNGGIACGCGNTGCLEAHASGRAIAKSYIHKAGLADGVNITAQDVANRARSEDKHALEVYRLEGYYIGRACAEIMNIINPKKIVIGGGVSHSYDLFAPSMLETVDKHIYRRANSQVKIERTGLKDTALLGAAANAFMRHD